ncbi:MAG: hypothetical protein HY606_09390 [Planctomycetes bacterium]|nr:hypothetical protein [Planctomycetota bacterium]
MFYNVKYGKMAYVNSFNSNTQLARNDECIVQTDRGSEWGLVLKETISSTDPNISVIRKVTTEDIKRKIYLHEICRPDEYSFCKEHINKLNLQMKLIDVDHLFGDEVIVFYFYSPIRVDFRELVRILAGKYHQQIELRQIGARDTTRISGGVGPCGRNLCCSSWKKDLGGVTYEMAQSQFENPEQQMLIGVCGKLKCCLKYEYESYVRSIKLLPSVGERIKMNDLEGIVVSRNLGMCIVTLEDSNGNKHTLSEERFVMPEPPPTGQNQG